MSRWGLTLPLPGCRCAPRASTFGAPRPPATPTCGAARPTAPTASPRSPLAAAWTERAAARHRRRRRLHARPGAARPAGGGARRRQRRPLRARDRRLLGPDRRGLERDPVRAAADAGLRDGRLPARRRSPASAPRPASSSSRRRREPPPIVLAALRGKMLRLAVEKADGAFTNFLPLSGLPQVVERARGRARRLRAALPLLLPARASASRSSRWRGSCSPPTPPCPSTRPSSAGSATARRSTAMVEAWAAKDRQRAAELAPWELIEDMFLLGDPEQMRERLGAVRRGRDHAAGADPDHHARQARRADRGAGARAELGAARAARARRARPGRSTTRPARGRRRRSCARAARG